jgi:hypothetical protein
MSFVALMRNPSSGATASRGDGRLSRSSRIPNPEMSMARKVLHKSHVIYRAWGTITTTQCRRPCVFHTVGVQWLPGFKNSTPVDAGAK